MGSFILCFKALTQRTQALLAQDGLTENSSLSCVHVLLFFLQLFSGDGSH